ncbi:membrane protein [Geomicrobium sp. JCM 19037]|uniref:sulfite exporter TauE/SafE family protein n=1 Tax=unclassified Geomicrobium TaxID=2628951 RepID=UPI00045F2858|nr:sulfite exporter TauE/SafE family protein [Geomicrobium sp. JCM 19037]GAK02119.1 membrane protein [Geomicrobium sp. JCM 19037]
MTLLFFICLIFVASVLQTSTGFGFSIMAMPLLLLIFPPQEAIQINIILTIFISLFLIGKIRGSLHAPLLKRIIISSVLGAPLGFLLFVTVNIDLFKLGISVVLLLLTVLLITRVSIRPTKNRDYIVGGFSGLFTTSIGMSGPPMLLYFTGGDAEKNRVRSTTIAFSLFINTFSLIAHMSLLGTNRIVWETILYSIPVVLIGIFAGQKLFDWLDQKTFKRILYVILGGTGLYLLIESIVTMI